jgi:hypothetical protein
LNWGPNTGNVANAAVVPLSAAGSIAVQVDGPGPLDLIYDINGYYATAPEESVLDTSRRAALDQFWTPGSANFGLTTVGAEPRFVKSDGVDLWVANLSSNSVSRVRASDGRLLETWTGASAPFGVLVAMGRVFVTSVASPGKLYRIDPSQPPGVVTTVASNLGAFPLGIAFDGTRIWTANTSGSVSIVTPAETIPWTVTTVTTGFQSPRGILYDGANIWVTDKPANTLLKLSSSGAILQTVPVGLEPEFPVFDGVNIWVPNSSGNSVTVVRASTGTVAATLTGNGLSNPLAAAFDGQRVLITDIDNNRVSLWSASALTSLGSFPTGADTVPRGACSDGVNFWITLSGSNQLARF